MKNDTPRREPLKELEARWERNRAARKWAVSKKLWDLPPEERMRALQSVPDKLRRPYKIHGAMRPKNLRGPVLIEYLMMLGITWNDRRFDNCINALYEHGIVNSQIGNPQPHEFTNRQGPEADAFNRWQQNECLAEISSLMKRGMEEKTACAKVAAEWGLPANSFEAAVEQLRYLIRQSAGKRRSSKRKSGKRLQR
jgi:hypothetical protein